MGRHKSTFGATCLYKHLLARLICICLIDQQKEILDYLLKLFQCYRPVVIYVKDAEYLLQVFFWRPVGHDVKDNHELTEVNVTVLIGVVHSEYMTLQLFCVRSWVALLHHHVEAFP